MAIITFHEFSQRSKAWNAAKLGNFSASEIEKIVSKKGIDKGAQTYIYKVAAEILTGEKEEIFQNSAMIWGIENEQFADIYFKKLTNLETYEIGGITNSKYDYCWVSPDRLIQGEKAGVEIKCPYSSAVHLKYWNLENSQEFKKECKEYWYQIQMNLLISEFDYWYFVSFDPRFLKAEKRMRIIKIMPDFNDLKECLLISIDLLKTLIK